MKRPRIDEDSRRLSVALAHAARDHQSIFGSDGIRTEALDSGFDAFSSREPVATSLENALTCSLTMQTDNQGKHP
jgi:hypothetical protein